MNIHECWIILDQQKRTPWCLKHHECCILVWLVGGLEHQCYFPIYWECHHPNWLSYFFRGVAQPPTSSLVSHVHKLTAQRSTWIFLVDVSVNELDDTCVVPQASLDLWVHQTEPWKPSDGESTIYGTSNMVDFYMDLWWLMAPFYGIFWVDDLKIRWIFTQIRTNMIYEEV